MGHDVQRVAVRGRFHPDLGVEVKPGAGGDLHRDHLLLLFQDRSNHQVRPEHELAPGWEELRREEMSKHRPDHRNPAGCPVRLEGEEIRSQLVSPLERPGHVLLVRRQQRVRHPRSPQLRLCAGEVRPQAWHQCCQLEPPEAEQAELLSGS